MLARVLTASAVAVAAVLLLLGSSSGVRPAEAASYVVVTSSNDSGPGTFRDAIDQANDDSSITLIKFLVYSPINLYDEVEYYGEQPLTLQGFFNTTIQDGYYSMTTGDAGIACHGNALFESSGGADLTLKSLTFQNKDCGNGVRVDIPDVYDEATAADHYEVAVTLQGVVLRNNSRNGLYIEEDDDYDYECDYTDASIKLTVTASTFKDNGDDGILVEEYGYGDLTAFIGGSQFKDNDDDGIDLNEECDGNLDLTATTSGFNNNGEDGVDADESGSGSLNATLKLVTASGNGEDGVDIDEDDYMYYGSVQAQADEEDDAAGTADDVATASEPETADEDWRRPRARGQRRPGERERRRRLRGR